jgi:Ni,Fe-hydrogenase III small subunit
MVSYSGEIAHQLRETINLRYQELIQHSVFVAYAKCILNTSVAFSQWHFLHVIRLNISQFVW